MSICMYICLHMSICLYVLHHHNSSHIYAYLIIYKSKDNQYYLHTCIYVYIHAYIRGLRLGTFSFGVSLKGRIHLRQAHAIEKGT